MTGVERSAADGAAPVTAGGDREGFAALFDRYRRELQVYCYRMLGSFHEAENLVQETFERAWRASGRVDASSSLRAWLYRIATNACLDALRQRGRRRVLPFEVMDPVRPDGPLPAAAGELWLEPFPDRLLRDLGGEAGPDPGETVVHRETIELVFLAAIQHLAARQRVVFIARDVMGWSAKATAALLGASEVSVRSARQRARAVMKQQLPSGGTTGARRSEWATASGRCWGATATPTSTTTSRRWPRCCRRICGSPIRSYRCGRPRGRRSSRRPGSSHPWGLPARGHQRQPATSGGQLLRAPGAPGFRLTALEALRIEGGQITEIVDFDLPDLSLVFGLAPTLPERLAAAPATRAADSFAGARRIGDDRRVEQPGPLRHPTPAADLQALGGRLVGAWRVSGGPTGRSAMSGWTAGSSSSSTSSSSRTGSRSRAWAHRG